MKFDRGESLALKEMPERLFDEVIRMNKAATGKYEDDRASINLPFDVAMHERVRALAKSYHDVAALIVVGIGGSNLGTLAVQQAVLGNNWNEIGRPKVYFADTVDAKAVLEIIAAITPLLESGKKVLMNGVSKSGSTTETIANFEIFVDLLKKHDKDYANYVVVTSDSGSPFHQLALNQGFKTLEIPAKVGGRYSVFSPVGLFPLAVLGLDTKALVEGAMELRDMCLEENVDDNPAIQSALLLHHHASEGRNIANTFVFSTELESFGKWYRQLLAESIGKEWNKDHSKQMWNGITPTVSVGSTDLHSMAQFYLGGPNDTYHMLVGVKKQNALKVPEDKEYDSLVKGIQGRQLPAIMNAIFNGFQAALKAKGRHFTTIILPDMCEHSLGALMQMKMMEVMYLAALMDVNAFDQPNVEEYKRETRKILSK
ncbi:MAG: hypothetical protein ABIA93_01380 [Candidatus Woesearchaeota archaeon]